MSSSTADSSASSGPTTWAQPSGNLILRLNPRGYRRRRLVPADHRLHGRDHGPGHLLRPALRAFQRRDTGHPDPWLDDENGKAKFYAEAHYHRISTDGVRTDLPPVTFGIRWQGNTPSPGCVLPDREDAMFCTQCGTEISEQARFCSSCGRAVKPEYAPLARVPVRLSRPMGHKRIGGVCAGFARYFDVDVTFMRILWLAIAVFTGGLGGLVYILAWIIMPCDEPAPVAQQPNVIRAA